MLIEDALAGVAVLGGGAAGVEVVGVQYDSRRVGPGDVFVAMRGGTVDGNRFVAAAVERGARVVVTDSAEDLGVGVPVVRVANGRRALAGIAANLLGHPERKLKVSAVTGTNGKTTTAWLLEQLLRSVGRKCVLVGTIETHVGDEVRVSEHTTPEASDLLRLFADGVAAGCTEVVMEMSSHALEQERVWGVGVDVGIFTNLTQDHLDYHGSMGAYGAAKKRLFEGVGADAPRVSVINADDPFGKGLVDWGMSQDGDCVPYGFGPDVWEPVEDVAYAAAGTMFTWRVRDERVRLHSPLAGKVNVYNLLAACCAALARGLTVEEIAAAVPKLRQVPGRFETLPNELGFTVVVDYAHTDDALRNLIGLARELVGAGRVITVFGCGGDRDRTKRPKMGRAAGERSDVVVLTSDNPRSEEPGAILAEALVGVKETGAECLVIEDRRAAIRVALGRARAGDIVLIAGKGHEKVQILKDGTVPFDDVAVAAAVLRELAGERVRLGEAKI